MGDRGPIPKRSEERRRRNSPDRPVDRVAIGGDADDLFGDDLPDERVEHRHEVDTLPTVVHVPADADWHPIAVQLYESLEQSGQSMFFEPSDWAAAYLICESISRDLADQWINVGTVMEPEMEKQKVPMKGANLAAYLKGLGELGVTEGSRRRLSIELTRAQPEKLALPEGVTDINDARKDLLG